MDEKTVDIKIVQNKTNRKNKTSFGNLGYLLKLNPNSLIKDKSNIPVIKIFIITLYPPKNSEGADKYPIIAKDKIPLIPEKYIVTEKLTNNKATRIVDEKKEIIIAIIQEIKIKFLSNNFNFKFNFKNFNLNLYFKY